MTSTDDVAETSLTARTDAGMLALWNPARFTAITDYQTWEDALLDEQDIRNHIRAGDLVPVTIGGDGAFAFLLRTGPAAALALTGREQEYLLVSSQPYLLRSGGTARLSGIEDISASPGPAASTLAIPPGSCSVSIHLIEWDAEPGARDQHGKAAATALPDFVILIAPQADETTAYRTDPQTFDRPGA